MMKVIMKMLMVEMKFCDLDGNGIFGLIIWIVKVFSCFQGRLRIY